MNSVESDNEMSIEDIEEFLGENKSDELMENILTEMSINLQKYCEDNLLPIFNKSETISIILSLYL